MKNTILVSALISLGFFFLSCNENSEFELGVFNDIEKILIETNDICVRIQDNEEEVKLIIEDLLNTSDNRDAEFPILDFLSIRVDINNNNLVDANVDKKYGISSIGTNCMQFIIDEGRSTVCMEEEGYSYNAYFEPSVKSSEDHIIYELIINKDNIFIDSETVGLIIVLKGEDSGGYTPFNISPLFIEAIKFSL